MNKWHGAFRRKVVSVGFENAYRRLKAYSKFNNYADNTTSWADNSAITYTEENGYTSEKLIDSCIIANDAIRNMLGSGKQLQAVNQ